MTAPLKKLDSGTDLSALMGEMGKRARKGKAVDAFQKVFKVQALA